MLPLKCRLNTNLFPDHVKLIGYLPSAVIMGSFNPCVGPSPRTKIHFFIINVHRKAHISTESNNVFTPATI